MFEDKEWNINRDPVILITPPKPIVEPTAAEFGCVVTNQYDYSESHLIYKGDDLGSFEELRSMKEENKKLKQQYCERIDCAGRLGDSKKVEELKASVKYYVDILTDLKKWLEENSETYMDYDFCLNTYIVLEKIKELEELHAGTGQDK